MEAGSTASLRELPRFRVASHAAAEPGTNTGRDREASMDQRNAMGEVAAKEDGMRRVIAGAHDLLGEFGMLSFRRVGASLFLVLGMVSPALSAPRASTPGPREWPSDIQSGSTTFTIHQPQIASWDGFRTSYSAALSARTSKDDTSIFGVATFSARTSIDKDERLVRFDDVKLASLRFPSAPEREKEWLAAIQDRVGPMTTTYDLDRFEAALAVVRAGRKSDDLPLKSDPPRLVFSTTAAMLILVDGLPAYRPVTGTTLQRVINTRVLLVKDGQGRHYLKLYDGWVSASTLEGPYAVVASAPKDLGKALQAATDADLLAGGDPQDPKTRPTLMRDAPAIVVATSPTELIVTEGEPSWVPIDGTRLLYVSNTTGKVLRLLSEQTF